MWLSLLRRWHRENNVVLVCFFLLAIRVEWWNWSWLLLAMLFMTLFFESVCHFIHTMCSLCLHFLIAICFGHPTVGQHSWIFDFATLSLSHTLSLILCASPSSVLHLAPILCFTKYSALYRYFLWFSLPYIDSPSPDTFSSCFQSASLHCFSIDYWFEFDTGACIMTESCPSIAELQNQKRIISISVLILHINVILSQRVHSSQQVQIFLKSQYTAHQI